MGRLGDLSKFISLILRHKPQVIGISLSEEGWANVNELIEGCNKKGRKIDLVTLEKIVKTDNKGRYSFNEDKTLIRANQGHSVKVDVGLQEKEPPDVLYHGTANRFLDSIKISGLEKRSRLYVHLTDNKDTAIKTGRRHGESIVLVIKAKEMKKGGYKFYLSENNVWLIDNVPVQYIEFK